MEFFIFLLFLYIIITWLAAWFYSLDEPGERPLWYLLSGAITWEYLLRRHRKLGGSMKRAVIGWGIVISLMIILALWGPKIENWLS